MQSFTVHRSGNSPLTFTGEIVFDGNSKPPGGCFRWHEVRIYKLGSGVYTSYVVEIEFKSSWRDEIGHSSAIIASDPGEVGDILRCHDPTERLRGFPPMPEFAERQKSLALDVKCRYDLLVSKALGSSPIFAERIS